MHPIIYFAIVNYQTWRKFPCFSCGEYQKEKVVVIIKGFMAVLMPKKDIYYSVERHFTTGKTYTAIYENETDDQGWVVADDLGAKHWLSPWDGHDHRDIHRENYITENFHIIKVQ